MEPQISPHPAWWRRSGHVHVYDEAIPTTESLNAACCFRRRLSIWVRTCLWSLSLLTEIARCKPIRAVPRHAQLQRLAVFFFRAYGSCLLVPARPLGANGHLVEHPYLFARSQRHSHSGLTISFFFLRPWFRRWAIVVCPINCSVPLPPRSPRQKEEKAQKTEGYTRIALMFHFLWVRG